MHFSFLEALRSYGRIKCRRGTASKMAIPALDTFHYLLLLPFRSPPFMLLGLLVFKLVSEMSLLTLGATSIRVRLHSVTPKRTKRISHPVRFISGDLIWQIVTIRILAQVLRRCGHLQTKHGILQSKYGVPDLNQIDQCTAEQDAAQLGNNRRKITLRHAARASRAKRG
jgi:hypothetical protein